jgi:hypothetical protein
MPQMSQVLKERAIGMLIAQMSTRPLAGEFNVHFSTVSHLHRFRKFGGTSSRPHRARVWHRVGERFADVNIFNRMPHGRVMVWAGISYGQ